MLPICWRSRRWLGGKNTWCFTPWSGDFWANPSHGCNSWCAQRVWGMIPEEARLGTTSLGMFSWLQLPWAAGTLTVPRSGSGLTTSLEWTGQITCSDIKYHGWNLKSKTPIPNEKLDGFWGIGNIVLFSKLFFDVWKSWASSSNLKRIIYRRNSSGFFLIIKLLVRKFPQNGEVTPPPLLGGLTGRWVLLILELNLAGRRSCWSRDVGNRCCHSAGLHGVGRPKFDGFVVGVVLFNECPPEKGTNCNI